MTAGIGLVLGFEPFAGLPTNPAELVLPTLDGKTIGGFPIVAKGIPVSRERLQTFLAKLIAECRPAFVMGMGLALGSPVVRVEKIAINAAHFGVADNDAALPLGAPISPDGPRARFATWDAEAVAEAVLQAGVPARISYHAGTHCCNLALYVSLGEMQATGLATSPCGFLHLPCLPEQIVWMMRRQDRAQTAPVASPDLPSMALELQVRAAEAAVRALANQAACSSPER